MAPIVRAAVTALDAFGCETREVALVLLPLWARYALLSSAQFDEVLAWYPPDPTPAPPAVPMRDVFGVGYGREQVDPGPSGEPPPDEVFGVAVSGRRSTAVTIPWPRWAA